MNREEAIRVLYQLAEETMDDLNRGRRQHTATQRLEALNVAIGAIRKQQESEIKEKRRM